MEYRKLGRTDLKVSSLALGCVTFDREIDPETSYKVMDHAIERGLNLFDTAEAYSQGKSEEVVGRWLKRSGKREQIVLATKAIPPLGKRLIVAAEASLTRLQTDVIDLYQLHAWDGDTPLEETLEALNTLVEQGKVRYIGCSNFMAWQLCKVLWKADVNGWVRMESVQPNYNLAVRDIESELLPFCAEEEIGTITYSPLGVGFLTGKYHTVGTAPEGTRFDIMPDHWDIYEGATSMQRMEGLRAKAEETGRSMVNLALSWVIGQPGVTSVLIGARKLSHIDQAFEAEQMGLEPDLREAFNAM
ncbi:aldo/keto reductase [Chloroflexi bacterium TSY]|nr:aldo/keto reductase [Chloroflexi bacterium TSY]